MNPNKVISHSTVGAGPICQPVTGVSAVHICVRVCACVFCVCFLWVCSIHHSQDTVAPEMGMTEPVHLTAGETLRKLLNGMLAHIPALTTVNASVQFIFQSDKHIMDRREGRKN